MAQMIIDYAAGKIPMAVKGGYDFVDVRDVVAGILGALEKGRPGESYLLSGHYLTCKELLDLVYKYYPLKRISKEMSMGFVKAIVPFFTLGAAISRRRPLFTKYSLLVLSGNGHFSHAKAAADFGYAPRTSDRTVRDTVEFLVEKGIISANPLQN